MTKNEIHFRASAATDSSETRSKKKNEKKNPHFYKAFMFMSSSKSVDLFVLSLGKINIFSGIQNSHYPKVRQM